MVTLFKAAILKRFWARLSDKTKLPRILWRPVDVGLSLENEEWQRQHDEVSKTLRRIMLTLLGYCLFCVFALGAPDSQLLLRDATIKMPFTGTYVSYTAFLIFGPSILIAISIYLHIFLGYWCQLASDAKSNGLPYIFNLNKLSARILSAVIFYWLPPLMLFQFYWKAVPRPEGYSLMMVAYLFGILMLWLAIRRFYIGRSESKKGKVLYGLLWIGMLYLISEVSLLNVISERDEIQRNAMQIRKINLYNADLSNQILKKQNLIKAYLSKANFSNTDLSEAIIDGAAGHEVNLEQARLENASLREAKLSSSIFDRANFNSADLYKVYLGFGKLNGSYIENANINNGNLIYTEWAGAKLSGTTLINADLLGANLKSADLTNANLSGARLSTASLKDANLKFTEVLYADLRDVKDLTCNQLKSAKNWELAYRSSELACGKEIPIAPFDPTEPPWERKINNK